MTTRKPLITLLLYIIILFPLTSTAQIQPQFNQVISHYYSTPITLTTQTISLHPHENRTIHVPPTIQLINASFLTGSITLTLQNQSMLVHDIDATITINNAIHPKQVSSITKQNTTIHILFAVPIIRIPSSLISINLNLVSTTSNQIIVLKLQGEVTFILSPNIQTTSKTAPTLLPLYPKTLQTNNTLPQAFFLFMPSTPLTNLNLTFISTDPAYELYTSTHLRYITTSHVITNITLLQSNPYDILLFNYKPLNTTLPAAILQARITSILALSEPYDTSFITILIASLFFLIPLVLRHYSYLHEQKKVSA